MARKGFKALILAAVQEASCSVGDILSKIGDPELKEQYIKNILYRAGREGLVQRKGGVYTWTGDANASNELQEKIERVEEKNGNMITNVEEPPAFDLMTDRLVYRCRGLWSNCERVINALTLLDLEQLHEEELGTIPQKAKEHYLYIPTLKKRVWRCLERSIRLRRGEELSPIVVERNLLWVDSPIMDVLDNPPETSAGLPWEMIAFSNFPAASVNTKGSGHKRTSKGFRGMIIDCIKKAVGGVPDIMKSINDPALKESYVKNIIYRLKKEGKIDEDPGGYSWVGEKG